MFSYVSLCDVKDYLRIDFDHEDAGLEMLMQAASSAVLDYLKDSELAYEYSRDEYGKLVLDSNDEPEFMLDGNGKRAVRFNVRAATLQLTGDLYKNREAGQPSALGHGYLPAPVVAMLYPLRTPTLS